MDDDLIVFEKIISESRIGCVENRLNELSKKIKLASDSLNNNFSTKENLFWKTIKHLDKKLADSEDNIRNNNIKIRRLAWDDGWNSHKRSMKKSSEAWISGWDAHKEYLIKYYNFDEDKLIRSG